MSTAHDIIKSALKMLGVVGAGETPSSEDSNDALVTLNNLISAWNLEGMNLYQRYNETLSITASTGSYTIGTSQTWNTDRPLRIENAFVRDSDNYDTPLRILNDKEYARITDKTETASLPEYLYYYNAYPAGTIYLWPVPTSTGLSCGLQTWKKLSTFAGLTTTVSLPDGYELALKENLAVVLAPEYRATISAILIDNARQHKAWIKSFNNKQQYMNNEMVDFGYGHGRFDILSGDYR